MFIKSVRLRNIRSYLDETISFPEGSTLLAGDIGTGKSSILLAIEFALFGIARGVLSGTALLRLGEDSGFVELSFEVDGKDCIIKRSLKRSKEDVRQDTGYIIIDGQKQEATPVELKSRVLELLGYPKSLLTKSKSLIYRYTVYTPQEEMKAILTDEAGIRLDTLRRLFQIDKYQRIRENAQILLKELRQRQATLKGQIMDIDDKEKLLAKAEADLERIGEEIELLIPKIGFASRAVADKRAEIKAKEAEIKEYNQLKSGFEVLKSQIAQKLGLMQQGSQEIESAKRQISLIETKMHEMKVEAAAPVRSLDDEIELLDRKRSDVMRQAAGIESEVKAQQKFRDDQNRTITDIASLKKCPLCLQDVRADHISHIKEEQRAKIEAAEQIILESSARLLELKDEQRKTEEKLLGLRLEVKQANELRLRLKEKENLENLLKDRQISVANLESKQKLLKKEIADLNSQRLGLDEQIEQRKGLDSQQESLKTGLELLEKTERSLLIESAKIKAEHDGIRKSKLVLEDELGRKRKARDELRLLVQKQNWLQMVFSELMTQMEQNVMMRVYNEFNEIFQQFFSMLLEDANLSVNLNEEFTPVIEQNGYDIYYEDLSGGEKTSIALAYRLALNKVINNLIDTIKTDDLIILDEPTDGFSSDQLDKMRSVLEGLNTKQTIIVSHEQKIESFVENVIRISKREHASSVN